MWRYHVEQQLDTVINLDACVQVPPRNIPNDIFDMNTSGRASGSKIGASLRLNNMNNTDLSPKVQCLSLIFVLVLTGAALLAIPMTLVAGVIPVIFPVSILLLPVLIIFIIYGIAWSAYLVLAQSDRPPYAMIGPPSLSKYIPFVPLSPLRCLQVTKIVCEFIWLGVGSMSSFWYWYSLYRQQKKAPEYETVVYSLPFSHNCLDIYPPDVDVVSQNAIVLMLVPTSFFPSYISCNRKLYMPMALRMRKLGYCVVVPDISYYPTCQIPQSVVDLRLALSWVGAHIFSYKGDPSRIYVMGMGISSELVALTLVQEAAVMSRVVKRQDDENKDPSSEEKSDRLEFNKLMEIYAPQVRLPSLAGVVLAAGLSDVIKCYLHNVEMGTEHLGMLRRWAGPRRYQCIIHSPTHLLNNTKDNFDPAFLPSNFLLIHGGRDKFVPISQAALLQSLLMEVGVKNVELFACRDLGHFDTLKMLLAYPTSHSDSCRYDTPMMNALCSFLV